MAPAEGSGLRVRPVGPDELPDLAALFETSRNTRRCWCTAFCTTGSRFAAGWVTGRNRRRFDALTRGSSVPMGVLASGPVGPVGWCACGPRSRYTAALAGRSRLLRALDRDEDERTWLVACLFVRADQRGRGLPVTLVRSAVELARGHGACAVEGWPVTGASAGPADAHLGRETLFTELGFRCVSRPVPSRAVVRLDLERPAT